MNIRSYPRLASFFNFHSRLIRNSMAMLLAPLVLIFAGCGGGEHRSAALYTINGQVSGLADGQQVTLSNNGVDTLYLTANGSFTFTTPVAYGASYNVTVIDSPTGQACLVTNNSGTGSGVNADVTSVQIVCSTNTFNIGGSVTGLTNGQQLTLLNNSADPLTVTTNGAFTFATPITNGASYNVTVSTQPTGQTCSVANNSGAGAGVTTDVSSVQIVCSTNTFNIGGSVTGLANGQQVTLLNNGSNARTVNTNGVFTFTTPVAYGSSYNVTVSASPTGKTCSVANNSGAGVTADVASVQIVCSTYTYNIGGSVSGLANGQQVTLLNNGGNARTVTANGAFTFTSPIAYGSGYNVTVSTQPTGQTCSVANNSGAGSGVTADVSSVQIVCSTNTYNIGGTLSGLQSGQQVTLLNNGGNAITMTANGTFTFTSPVAYGASFAVTVSAQPTSDFQWCTVSGGTGTVNNAISNIAITCGPASVVASTVEATRNKIFRPRGMAFDSSGNLYITSSWGELINKLDPSGNFSTFAGSGAEAIVDGRGTAASFFGPTDIVVDQNNNLYVSECSVRSGTNRGAIRKIDTSGYVSTVASNLGCVFGLTLDSSGNNLYAAESTTNKILKITTSGNVTTFAGSGTAASVDGQGTAASFNYPGGLVFDGNGNLFVSDAGGHKIRKIDPSGNVTTFAGSGAYGNANGQGTAASFGAPFGMAFDNGILYIADSNRIRRIDANGNVTTLAGSGNSGKTDGPAATASFNGTWAVILDRRGGLYVSDCENFQIRRISPAAP